MQIKLLLKDNNFLRDEMVVKCLDDVQDNSRRETTHELLMPHCITIVLGDEMASRGFVSHFLTVNQRPYFSFIHSFHFITVFLHHW